jgi:serine/threonine protein kinase
VDLLSIGIVSKTTGMPTIISDEECEDFEKILLQSHSYTKSPEVLQVKERDYGVKADMWTVGVLAYNMITGIPPFYESSDNFTKDKIKNATFSC